MKDRLARIRSNVEHRAIPLLDVTLAGDLRRHQVAVANNLGILRHVFLDVDDVLFGNDQNVRRRLGLDVLKSVDAIVFEHLLRRNLAGNDLAEQTVGHGAMLANMRQSREWRVTIPYPGRYSS